MTLHKKLNGGLGFLFAIIFGLIFFCSFYVQKIAAESDNVLKDNYASVVYAKSMTVALDTMHSSVFAKARGHNPAVAVFEHAKAEFEKNLSLEEHDITETNEKDYVESVAANYQILLKLSGQLTPGSEGEALFSSQLAPAYDRIRESIDDIFDVNMQAILRKNQHAKDDAKSISHYMAAIGVFFLLLALGYFWYFPFYVSYSLSYLAEKMKELVVDAGLESRSTSDDEFVVIMNSIDLLRAKLKLTEGRK